MENSTPTPNSQPRRRRRAKSSGRRLSGEDAALVKGMLDRGDRQSDIAARFRVNSGRISEISTGQKFAEVRAAPLDLLPPLPVGESH